MADAYKIEVHKRDNRGSLNVKNLRKEGKIPGIYYSVDSKKSVPFYILNTDLALAFRSGAHLYQVSVGGKLKNVIFKEVQYHPVTDDILHVDIYGVSLKEKIDIKVPIHLIGEAKGVSADGGHLTQSLNDIDIKCFPAEIPEFIEVDVTEIGINDSLYVRDVVVPDNVEITASEDLVVASITLGITDEDLITETVEGDDEFTFDDDEGENAEDGSGSQEESTSE
jgi:large subunit ribosomal protein L25